MVRLNVLALLEAQGHTRYWLNKQLGMGYTNFKKMVENQTRSISFEHIEALCNIFECTPNDLFAFDENLPEGNR